jgi:hypothetical protein
MICFNYTKPSGGGGGGSSSRRRRRRSRRRKVVAGVAQRRKSNGGGGSPPDKAILFTASLFYSEALLDVRGPPPRLFFCLFVLEGRREHMPRTCGDEV